MKLIPGKFIFSCIFFFPVAVGSISCRSKSTDTKVAETELLRLKGDLVRKL